MNRSSKASERGHLFVAYLRRIEAQPRRACRIIVAADCPCVA
jgi:hypothetical protein